MVDDKSAEGIVSPDYVVIKSMTEKLLPRFLYFWLRSRYGADAILGSARGAVRERMMFKGLAKLELPLPDLDRQFHFDRLYVAVQEARARLSRQQQQLDALEPALLRVAFSGAL
jgi:type I restriction enzyme, S subunit